MGWTETPIPMMSSWEASDVYFDDVRVPGRNVLGQVGHGFELAMRWIGRGRVRRCMRPGSPIRVRTRAIIRRSRIFEGTDEIQKRSIARNLLREHVRVGSWDQVRARA